LGEKRRGSKTARREGKKRWGDTPHAPGVEDKANNFHGVHRAEPGQMVTGGNGGPLTTLTRQKSMKKYSWHTAAAEVSILRHPSTPIG